jgi:hypothetical protein
MKFALPAATALALAACGSSGSKKTAQQPSRPMCAAQIPGTDVAVQDIAGGARVTYSTSQWRQAESLRAHVNNQLQPSSARAAGGEPESDAMLPPVQVQVQPTSDGTSVTWVAAEEKDQERVRELVRWDADVQKRGYCSQLRVPQSSSYFRTPQPQ